MRIFKRGSVWYLDVSHEGKRVIRRVSRDKKEAFEVLAETQRRMLENTFDLGVKVTRKKLVENLVDEFKEKAKDKKCYSHMILPQTKNIVGYFAGREVSKIHLSDVEGFKEFLGEKSGHVTANRALAVLRMVYKYAIKNNLAKTNPVQGAELYDERSSRRVRHLSDVEISKLLEHCNEYTGNVVKIAINTGLRKSEITRLSFNDVDFTLGQLCIGVQKNGNKDYLPLNKTAQDVLLSMKRDAKGGYPFAVSWRKDFDRAVKNSGIKDFHFHDLRHTFASNLVMRGVDLFTVSRLMRHADVNMSQRYAHLSPNFLKSAVYTLEQSGTNPVQVYTSKP